MDTTLVTFLIFVHFPMVFSDKYTILPPIYKMEDYNTCLENNNSYCKIDARLMNTGYENNLWKLINDTINNKYCYDRSIIHRAICLPKDETLSLDTTKHFSQLRINEEFDGTNLLALVEDAVCTEKDKVKISLYDKLLLLSFLAYICLIIYATVMDRQKKITKNKIIASFSLISNWKKVCNTEGNEDYNKLKSIQGIRFYNMLIIICAHTTLSFTVTYIANPTEVENLFRTASMENISSITGFLVQTFFLISSWIVTFQIYNIYRDYGKFTIKQAFILIINRFFRIGICSIIMILVLKSSWYRLHSGPQTFDDSNRIQESCKHNWWQTLYFMNNHLYLENMCHPLSWYLSVDFHLYIMTVMTIYLILKYKLSEWKVTSFLIFFSCILYGSVIYVNEVGMFMRTNINSLRRYILLRSDSLRVIYFSTYSSWTTSILGMSLGIIYTKNKYRIITTNKIISVLWLLIFLGLPSAMIFTVNHEFRGIQEAILGTLVKPLFSLGIGIGILGMSHNIGGPIKRICENKYVVLMSNFSFCTYIFQLLIIFSKGFGTYSLIKFDETELIKWFLFFDAPVSILIGFICTLLIEQPGINLQKILLPQIERKKQKQ